MPLEQVVEKTPTRGAISTQICTRCIMNTTVPGIRFDEKGECSFCRLHDKLDRFFPLNAEGQKRFQKIIEGVRKKGRGKKYDCVIGISGGRDSIYTLHYSIKGLGLRPLAVHFNDGFGNPMAGENMLKAVKKLGVELRTVTSDWRESKDLRLIFLKASTPDLAQGTDLGIATALYGVATAENVKTIIIGQSFRTEGISPLSWNYLDGKYLKSVHQQFGQVPLRPWRPADPGFNLNIFQLFYYAIWKRISIIPILYYVPYVRKEAEAIIQREYGWVYPGAHYFDDLYQSILSYVLRVKFNIDRRLFNYSALIRSGQMGRAYALEKVSEVYTLEDPEIINLSLKRLGVSRTQFDEWLALPPKTFRDYPNHYGTICKFRWLVKILSKLRLLPPTAYDKYFNCGE